MEAIVINDYKECESETCIFRRECAQHCTAGDFRSEDGFSPDIVTIDGNFYCKTSSQPVFAIYPFGNVPDNYEQLERGFVSLISGVVNENHKFKRGI